MKYDLTSNFIFLIPVIKVKYINSCKEVFDFKYMVLFLVCLFLWLFGGLIDMFR